MLACSAIEEGQRSFPAEGHQFESGILLDTYETSGPI